MAMICPIDARGVNNEALLSARFNKEVAKGEVHNETSSACLFPV
jgi:hypothetical protein